MDNKKKKQDPFAILFQPKKGEKEFKIQQTDREHKKL